MSQNKKRNEAFSLNRPVNANLIADGGVVDFAAALEVNEIDTAADRAWLAEHPEADERLRPVSSREIAAYGLPPGCFVVVKRGPLGSQFSMICQPRK